MGLVQNLKKTLNNWVDKILVATILSLHKTPGKTNYEETRQLFIHGVLTESLDTGGPAKYYNSNILSRYFRKDYYDGD